MQQHTTLIPFAYSILIQHTDPQSFLTTAQILKGIGVSAYLGILSKITNADVLTVAASILAVESTQRAWIRSGAQHEDGIGGAFDTALDFDQVCTSLLSPLLHHPPGPLDSELTLFLLLCILRGSHASSALHSLLPPQ